MRFRIVVAVFLLLAAGVIHAHRSVQEVPSELFVPEFVLASSESLSLTVEQAADVEALAGRLSDELQSIHERAAKESAVLLRLFETETVDETAALSVIDRLLDLERQAKRLRLQQVIRVKNLLSAEQQARLIELRFPEVGDE